MISGRLFLVSCMLIRPFRYVSKVANTDIQTIALTPIYDAIPHSVVFSTTHLDLEVLCIRLHLI